jgi:phage RecT family recombinase
MNAPNKQNPAPAAATPKENTADRLAQAASNVTQPAVNTTPGTALQPAEPKSAQDNFGAYLDAHKRDFALVLPKSISVDRILRLALSAIRRNPTLMSCSVPSLMGAIMEATCLGLEPNTPLGHAYLVPFRSAKLNTTEAVLVIGYEGYIELFYRSGKVQTVFANVVYAADTFEYHYGLDESLTHKEAMLPVAKRGEITHFYAYARMTGGAYRFVVLTKQQVDEIRDEFSASYAADPKNSIWATDYIAMGKKSAILRLEKWLPKSAELRTAVNAEYQVIDSPQTLASFTPPVDVTQPADQGKPEPETK